MTYRRAYGKREGLFLQRLNLPTLVFMFAKQHGNVPCTLRLVT